MRIKGKIMQQLKLQRETERFMIADIIIDGKVVGWTVTDRQLQRVTKETFETAAKAFEWAENSFKGLSDEC